MDVHDLRLNISDIVVSDVLRVNCKEQWTCVNSTSSRYVFLSCTLNVIYRRYLYTNGKANNRLATPDVVIDNMAGCCQRVGPVIDLRLLIITKVPPGSVPLLVLVVPSVEVYVEYNQGTVLETS